MEWWLQIINWFFVYHFWGKADDFETWSPMWLLMLTISAVNGAAIMHNWF